MFGAAADWLEQLRPLLGSGQPAVFVRQHGARPALCRQRGRQWNCGAGCRLPAGLRVLADNWIRPSRGDPDHAPLFRTRRPSRTRSSGFRASPAYRSMWHALGCDPGGESPGAVSWRLCGMGLVQGIDVPTRRHLPARVFTALARYVTQTRHLYFPGPAWLSAKGCFQGLSAAMCKRPWCRQPGRPGKGYSQAALWPDGTKTGSK
jgi:hypothetical protein